MRNSRFFIALAGQATPHRGRKRTRQGRDAWTKLGFSFTLEVVDFNRDDPGKRVLVVVEDEENRHVLRLLCESEYSRGGW